MKTEKEEKFGLPVVAVRLAEERSLYSDTPINTADTAVRCLKNEISGLDREAVACIFLTTNMLPISVHIASIGSLRQSLAAGRELFKAAILANASGMILMHNHPSGDPKPSREDRDLTKRIEAMGALLDIRLFDHIIVAPYTDRYVSMLEQHYIGLANEADEVMKQIMAEKSRERKE